MRGILPTSVGALALIVSSVALADDTPSGVICRVEGYDVALINCVFRRIRPPIPITSGRLFRSIRPPVTRCREAVRSGYQILGFSSSFLAMVFRMEAPSSSMRYAL
jgi:hypothetical protein